jgi:hypothetical protein
MCERVRDMAKKRDRREEAGDVGGRVRKKGKKGAVNGNSRS